jgi:phosphoribosyl-dephospho-CoA transferase
MIEVKIGDLLGAQDALNRFLELKMPLKASYRLQKAFRLIAGEIETFDKVRIKTVEEYGTVNEQGGREVPPENMDAFRQDIQALLEEVIQLEVHPIPLDMLADVDVQVADVLALHFLFSEE